MALARIGKGKRACQTRHHSAHHVYKLTGAWKQQVRREDTRIPQYTSRKQRDRLHAGRSEQQAQPSITRTSHLLGKRPRNSRFLVPSSFSFDALPSKGKHHKPKAMHSTTNLQHLTWQELDQAIRNNVPGAMTEESLRIACSALGIPRWKVEPSWVLASGIGKG